MLTVIEKLRKQIEGVTTLLFCTSSESPSERHPTCAGHAHPLASGGRAGPPTAWPVGSPGRARRGCPACGNRGGLPAEGSWLLWNTGGFPGGCMVATATQQQTMTTAFIEPRRVQDLGLFPLSILTTTLAGKQADIKSDPFYWVGNSC